MLPDQKIFPRGSDQDNHFDDVRVFLETLPCPIILWSRDRSFCLLNQSAKRLINFSEADFLKCRSLWVDRIYSGDKKRYLAFQEELVKGKSPVTCDYRILPNDTNRPIWIRDVSVSTKDQGIVPWNILSAYTEISDLKAVKSTEKRTANTSDVIKLLFHDLQNCFQLLTWELELTGSGLKERIEPSRLSKTLGSMKRLVHDLQVCCLVPLDENIAPQDPVAILERIARDMRPGLNRQRVNLRLVRRGPLPMVRADREHLRSAFQRVFEFCGGLLVQGGNLDVEAAPKEVGGQVYAKVTVTSFSPVSIEFSERESLQPYLTVENERIGIGMTLATEIFKRYQGQVSVRKGSKNRGQVTILMKASPN